MNENSMEINIVSGELSFCSAVFRNLPPRARDLARAIGHIGIFHTLNVHVHYSLDGNQLCVKRIIISLARFRNLP